MGGLVAAIPCSVGAVILLRSAAPVLIPAIKQPEEDGV